MSTWQDSANCNGAPEAEGLFSDDLSTRRASAEFLCTDCPVKYLCLQEGFDFSERFGVRGGVDQSKLREVQHMDALGRASTSVIYSTKCVNCATVIPLTINKTHEVTCPTCELSWTVLLKD